MRKVNDSEQPLLAFNELFDSGNEIKPDADEVLDRDEFERMEAIALKNRAQTIPGWRSWQENYPTERQSSGPPWPRC